MRKKKEKLFSKVIMVLFLIMIVLGFSLPGVLNLDKEEAVVDEEQHLCQNDADCYLICDGQPVRVLCFQNLCQQNACEGVSYFEYQTEPVTFSLEINVEGEEIIFANRTSEKDFFITFSEGRAQSHSSGLSLGHVLDKLRIMMDSQCLLADNQNYCSDGEKELKVLVNGEEDYSYDYYVPVEGDVVRIVYS